MTTTELKQAITRLEKERQDSLRDIWLLLNTIPDIEREIALLKLQLYKQTTEKHKEGYLIYGITTYSKVPII